MRSKTNDEADSFRALKPLVIKSFDPPTKIALPRYVVGGGLDIIEASWDRAAEVIERSYSDAYLMLENLRAQEEEAWERTDDWVDALRFMSMVESAVRDKARAHGSTTPISQAPPIDEGGNTPLHGWAVDWRRVEEPSTLVYIYTPEDGCGDTEVPLDYRAAERSVSDSETWGSALQRIEEAAFEVKSAHDSFFNHADLLRFRLAVLRHVLWQQEWYGHVRRWSGLSGTERARAVTVKVPFPGAEPEFEGQRENALWPPFDKILLNYRAEGRAQGLRGERLYVFVESQLSNGEWGEEYHERKDSTDNPESRVTRDVLKKARGRHSVPG